MHELLKLKEIELSRGEFTLRVPQLCLRSGGLYLLQGENGAGKSTLLQLLALLRAPARGEVFYAGNPVTWREKELRPLRQQVTLVEQNPLLFAGSVAQNLAFGLKLRGIAGARQRQAITEALGITGLAGFEERNARDLLGGESRRVALARALALQPQLLLLDEPTANLDGGQVAALERFLVALPQRGISLVIATHDPQQPERLGGEVIRLRDGVLEQPQRPQPPRDVIPLLRRMK